jgi:ATP-dependent DNA ligase
LYAFDLLELNGEDYRQHPLEQRKAKLEKILTRTQGMRLSEHLTAMARASFNMPARWD